MREATASTPSPVVFGAPPPRPEAPPLVLAAPDWHVIDTLARREDPPVLWPVGNASLIAHWLDHAVRLGCRAVTIYCPDRPAAIRAALEGGAYWSLNIDLRPTYPPGDAAVKWMESLPGQPAPASTPNDGAELVRWWLALNQTWLATRDPAVVQVDSLREPGGWIGPRAVISPGVVLKPPYWIGAGTLVGEGCVIGPGALIGPGGVLSADVHLRDAFVQSGTFIGAHLDVHGKLLLGATLLDPVKGARADLADDFISAAMKRPTQGVPSSERMLAVLLWLPAHLLAFFAGGSSATSVILPGGAQLNLPTAKRGPLLARRARWLRSVIAGRLRLIGILPRESSPAGVPEETRALLAHTFPGVFSLADLHGAHSTDEPDELAHALYQAALPESDREVRGALLKLCFTCPAP